MHPFSKDLEPISSLS